MSVRRRHLQHPEHTFFVRVSKRVTATSYPLNLKSMLVLHGIVGFSNAPPLWQVVMHEDTLKVVGCASHPFRCENHHTGLLALPDVLQI